MAPEKKRLLSYALVLGALGVAAALLTKFGIHSNKPFHTNISTISAMGSLFAGLLSLVRYYAKRDCPYLWVGLAFFGNGIIEICYVYTFSFSPNLQVNGLDTFMIWGWWTGRMYISSMLLGSYITCQKRPYLNDGLAYIVSIPLLLALLSVLLFIKAPHLVRDSFLARPLELIPATLLTITLIFYYRKSLWKQTEFYHWLIISLLLCTVTQLLIIPFSRDIYDTKFMYANILRAMSHLLICVGVLSEIFKLYRSAQVETKKLEVLRLMVDQIKDYALFMLDPTGHIATWNKGAQSIKGYTSEEIIGKHFSTFYPNEDNKAGKPAMELREAIKQGHYLDEGWRIKKDGSRFWAYVLITPIYNETGTLIGFSKLTRDLTERMMAEEALRRKNEALTQSNEELQQFAYIATHDLKEPLRSISSFTELLVRECRHINKQTATYSDIVTRAVRRLAKLIDDLRTYNIIGKQGPEQTPVDMTQCLHDALNLLKKKTDENKAVIHEVALPVVKGSLSQFTYLFMHLIDNAINYAKPGIAPVIDIGCTESAMEYTFSIKDNGMGIAKEFQEKIFTISKRLVNREKTDGSGIGLSICKKVVLLYGGRIWFESNENGTTFFFTLPKIHLPLAPTPKATY
jgi:PAS domain S-box-containing protein